MENFIIVCPCCEAKLTVDAATGAVLAHEEKKKNLGTFDEMLKNLDKQKEEREKLFAQELSAQKERERILAEKFDAALKRADEEKDKPFVNPLDL
jgi:hypothetical protein